MLIVDDNRIRLRHEALLDVQLHFRDVERAGLEIELEELLLSFPLRFHLQLLFLFCCEYWRLWAGRWQLESLLIPVMSFRVFDRAVIGP